MHLVHISRHFLPKISKNEIEYRGVHSPLIIILPTDNCTIRQVVAGKRIADIKTRKHPI